MWGRGRLCRQVVSLLLFRLRKTPARASNGSWRGEMARCTWEDCVACPPVLPARTSGPGVLEGVPKAGWALTEPFT